MSMLCRSILCYLGYDGHMLFYAIGSFFSGVLSLSFLSLIIPTEFVLPLFHFILILKMMNNNMKAFYPCCLVIN